MTPSGNPVVDHLDQKLAEVHPLARAALAKAFSAPAAPVESAPGDVQTLTGFPGREEFHADPFGGVSQLPQGSPAGEMPASPHPLARAGSMTSPLPPSYQEPTPSPAHQRQAEAMKPRGTAGIQNPWLRVPLQVLEGIGTGLAPGIAAAIPGSQLHQALVRQSAQHGVEAETEEQDAATKRALEMAQTHHAEAQAYNLEHPMETPVADQYSPLAGESGYGAFNKSTGKVTPVTVGDKPFMPAGKAEKTAAPHYHTDAAGNVLATSLDPTTGKYTTEKVYHGDPKIQTDVVKLAVGGKPHTVIVNKETGETIRDLGETGEKPPIVNGNAETGRLDRETAQFGTPYQKALDAATATLERVDSAKAMLSQGAVGQALELPKLLTAVVSGAGTGVRITQPEITRILGARGWGGTIEAWLSKAVGNGDLSTQQKLEIARVLDEVRATVEKKQAIANDTLDKMRGARSREEIIAADKAARASMAGGGQAQGGGTVNMKAPDGTVRPVPSDQVQHYQQMGATVVK